MKWGGGEGDQAYSRLSTPPGHITDCKLGVGGVCRCMRGDLMWTCLVVGRTIYARERTHKTTHG